MSVVLLYPPAQENKNKLAPGGTRAQQL
jgi:hypothetical protein